MTEQNLFIILLSLSWLHRDVSLLLIFFFPKELTFNFVLYSIVFLILISLISALFLYDILFLF